MAYRKLAHFSPGRTILFSIFVMILSGTLLLALPAARTTSMSFLDLLFTATSATCVTGLFTIPIEQFTPIGHAILLILIQIGGLGMITMTLFLMSLFIDLGLTTQLMAGQLLEVDTWKHIWKIIFFIIAITLCAELLGACCIYIAIKSDFTFFKAAALSIFHAVSSFCNAGISLFPLGLLPYSSNYIFLITTMILVFCGGLGFITWREIFTNMSSWYHDKRILFSLQSKLVLLGTAFIIATMATLILILEHDHAFAHLDGPATLLNSLFHAISFRSAGFFTIAIDQLHPATLFLTTLCSFIGSSPGSTGSGIKIIAFILLLATIKAGINGKYDVEIKGRRIARDQIHKALTIIALSLFWLAIVIFFLLITEQGASFAEIFFETVSAFTNLGLSTGLTPYLSSYGKWFILMSMIIGRIGSLTLIMALYKSRSHVGEFSYPEERVTLG